MLNKLTIKAGIIQDKAIDGIPVKIDIVEPSGARNVRTMIKMKEIIGITNHNTANTKPTATDEMHAKWLQSVENADREYVSVHLFVDDNSITQCVPLDEFCYHAGDGARDGNRKTIAVEICENGNILKAEENAKKLNAALILSYYPKLKVYKHQDWSGKYCPRVILSRKTGWTDFVEDINALVKAAKTPVIKPAPVSRGDKPIPFSGRMLVYKFLKPLMTGTDVLAVQVKLGLKGKDGKYGILTYSAVKSYQKKNGLKVDGRVGKITWGRLFNS